LGTQGSLQNEIQRNEQRSASLRQSILRAAFTGQLVPQDPTDEPASALLERIRAERANTSGRKAVRNLKERRTTKPRGT
jgi:type I restriction enzyme S subunit